MNKEQIRSAVLTKNPFLKLTYYRWKLSKTCVQNFVQKIRVENGRRLVFERAGAYLHFDAVPLRYGRGAGQVSNWRRCGGGGGRKTSIHFTCQRCNDPAGFALVPIYVAAKTGGEGGLG